MFNTTQLATINTGRYTVYFFYEFDLSSGLIKWTTAPYDVDGYESENYLLGQDDLTQGSSLKAVTTSIEIAGTISILAAFDKCQNRQVTISIAVVGSDGAINRTPIFFGKISKYQINRKSGEATLTLDLTDRIGQVDGTRPRGLTPYEQRINFGGDESLKYMSEDIGAVFWGKET